MGLPARQRRALDHIDRVLRGSDPRLVAMYSIFDRLARGEPLPRFEQLRSGLLSRLALLGAILATVAAHLHIRVRIRRRVRVGRRVHAGRQVQARRRVPVPRMLRLRPRQRAILLYPLAIALTIGSIVLAARSGPDRGCLPVRAVAAAKNVAKSSLCQQGTLSPLPYGH
jgi:hypothetical protein